MTPGEGPGSFLAPPLTVWPANPGLHPHNPYTQYPSPCPLRTPLQAQGGGEPPLKRHRGAGLSAQVRVNRSGPRVVSALDRRRGRVFLGIVLWYVGANPHEANLAVLADGPCGWLVASLMAEVLDML